MCTGVCNPIGSDISRFLLPFPPLPQALDASRGDVDAAIEWLIQWLSDHLQDEVLDISEPSEDLTASVISLQLLQDFPSVVCSTVPGKTEFLDGCALQRIPDGGACLEPQDCPNENEKHNVLGKGDRAPDFSVMGVVDSSKMADICDVEKAEAPTTLSGKPAKLVRARKGVRVVASLDVKKPPNR